MKWTDVTIPGYFLATDRVCVGARQAIMQSLAHDSYGELECSAAHQASRMLADYAADYG